MKNLINIEGFKHVDSINYDGRTYQSVYNHNLYYNEDLNLLWKEEYVDNVFFTYSSVTSGRFLGNIDSSVSIFDEDFEGYQIINGKKHVELDTELW